MQTIFRRRYTDDFKTQAIALAESIGQSKASRQLEMSVKTLSHWLEAARAGRALSSPNRKPVSEMESELARLQAENATLRMEREILNERMPDDLVRPAFLKAHSASPVGAGVLFHSDRGSPYASGDFGKTLLAHGFMPSMSRKGNCWDKRSRRELLRHTQERGSHGRP